MLGTGGSQGTSLPSPGKDSLSSLLGNPAGFTEEQQVRPEWTLRGPLEPQILQDKAPISLAEVLQVSFSFRLINKYTPSHPNIIRCLKTKAWLRSQ